MLIYEIFLYVYLLDNCLTIRCIENIYFIALFNEKVEAVIFIKFSTNLCMFVISCGSDHLINLWKILKGFLKHSVPN